MNNYGLASTSISFLMWNVLGANRSQLLPKVLLLTEVDEESLWTIMDITYRRPYESVRSQLTERRT